MKDSTLRSVCLWAGAALLLSGCAETGRLVITEPVGPVHGATTPGALRGRLVVYSAWDRFDTLDTKHPKHTSYIVRSEQGTSVARVHNQTGSFDGEPEAIELAPGRYLIEARATNTGPIKVPAVIRPGATTVVYLDGITEPTAPWPGGTNWIRQPDGRIVGWRDLSSLPTTERASVSEP